MSAQDRTATHADLVLQKNKEIWFITYPTAIRYCISQSFSPVSFHATCSVQQTQLLMWIWEDSLKENGFNNKSFHYIATPHKTLILQIDDVKQWKSFQRSHRLPCAIQMCKQMSWSKKMYVLVVWLWQGKWLCLVGPSLSFTCLEMLNRCKNNMTFYDRSPWCRCAYTYQSIKDKFAIVATDNKILPKNVLNFASSVLTCFAVICQQHLMVHTTSEVPYLCDKIFQSLL